MEIASRAMNKTKIEWADYTWNPVTGCTNNCGYCYARKIAHRFKGTSHYMNGFEPTFHAERIFEPIDYKKPSRIFTCSMGELFIQNHGDWTSRVFDTIRFCDWHTFQLLTKQPQNLKAWSPFPVNCWVGVTATDYTSARHAIDNLAQIKATVKFISFEPIKSVCTNIPIRFAKSLELAGVNWLILGQQTPVSKKTTPHINWVSNIEASANIANIPIFEKNNLRGLLNSTMIQQFPQERNEQT
jgi:protein gp37